MKKVFLFVSFAVLISICGGISEAQSQTYYDIRVLVGSPDCDALENCTWTITLYEYSSTLGSQEVDHKTYVYGTSTYNFDDVELSSGYIAFYVTMTTTGCYDPHHNVTSSYWVPNPPPYSHTFEVNPCGW